MQFIIQFIFLFFVCSYLHAEEEEDSSSYDFHEFYEKGQQQDVDQDIGEMEITLSAEFEPLCTIAGCVNLASGDFFQVDHDFIGDTIDPIHLTRLYDDDNFYETFLGFKFGCQYPLLATHPQDSTRHSNALIEERNGFFLPYQGKSAKHIVNPRLFKKGYTNLCRGSLSAQTNHINWSATYHNGWVVDEGDGSRRIYNRPFNLIEERRKQLGIPTKNLYLLTEHIKPNGNRLKFDYQTFEGKPHLSKVWTVNRQGRTLNFINFQYSNSGCTLESSCGKRLEYFHSHSGLNVQGVWKKILMKVDSSQKGTISYDYCFLVIPNVYRVNKPDGRFIQAGFNDGKVSRLIQNSGAYYFTYNKYETLVEDPLGHMTSYQFDSNKRLQSINYLKKTSPVRQEVFSWSEGPGCEGRLESKGIMLSNQFYQLSTFSYDNKGNVIEKAVYGNLTGEKSESFARLNEAEKYCTRYIYSQDNRNLLLCQNTPSGWSISYDYLPQTNLRTSILQSYLEKIQERVFYTYDENGEVKTQIEDDGSSTECEDITDVTYRRFKEVIAEKNPELASFGKPKKVIEGYLSNGRKITLTKRKYAYDTQGREIGVKVYNSKGSYCYKTSKAYDSFGRIILETNPLRQKTRFAYNDSHQIIEEELIGSGKITSYSYDSSGWMTSKTEKHASGELFITAYTYDALGNLIQEKDPYGQETTYSYDRLGRQTKKVIGSDGALYEKRYNILDQMTSETDPNGNATLYSYNIYGSKTKITHPDGSVERSAYYTNGWLKQHWKADGTSIKFSYDPKGRVVKELTLDINGDLLKKESFKYKGNLLIEKQDAMGLRTVYIYDGAGRKVEERVGSKITSYTYDDFGQITTIIYPLGANELYTYDFLGRVTSKMLQDDQGKVYSKETYAYDIHGNEIEKKCLQGEGNWISYLSHYGSDGRVLLRKDPLGNRTTWDYDHDFINEKSQKVLACTIKDPLGRINIEVNDTYGRLATKDYLENNILVSRVEYAYNLTGKEIEKKTSVYVNGEKVRDFWIISTYDKRGQLSSVTEMPDEKTTRYSYNALGKLVLKEKPDGVSIVYDYDSLGRMSSLCSQDVHYAYTYDLHDNPTEVHNLINNTIQKMSYDLDGNLLEEELCSGVALSYCYDENDRIIKTTLPDGSSIGYVYDPFHLVKVERFNPQGELAYTCTCPAYDLRGNRLQDDSPAGSVNYIFNERNRKVKINSSFWKSSLDEFDPIGNLLALTQNDPSHELKISFAYDRFDHLIKDGSNSFLYDSLGNCLKKNKQPFEVNNLNQLTTDSISIYSYDLNGNLISQTNPDITYTYDSLNRLKTAGKTFFSYDAFGRCLSIKDKSSEKILLYQGVQEIGSLVYGQIQELRLVHPNPSEETTFAIEINQEPYFPIQDDRYNVTALRHMNGSLVQYSRFSPFGEELLLGDISFVNPWRFANRRQVEGLSLFTKRFYNPRIMRWQTPDPLGFEDGLNLYTFVHNNPFRYYDHDGQWAVVIPIIVWGVETICVVTINTVCAVLGSALIYWSGDKLADWYENRCLKDDVEEGYAPDRPLPHNNGVHVPDTDAPHTQLGTRDGKGGRYRQAREFDKDGNPVRDIDFTDHRRPHNHTNPHQHEWQENPTGGSRLRGKQEPLTDWKYK